MKHYLILVALILNSTSFASSKHTLLEKKERIRVDLCADISQIYTKFFESYEGLPLNSQYSESDVLFNENMRNHPGNKLLLEIIYRLQSRFNRFCEIHFYRVPNCIYSMLESFGSKFMEYDKTTQKWVTVPQERAEELIAFYFLKFLTFFETPSK